MIEAVGVWDIEGVTVSDFDYNLKVLTKIQATGFLCAAMLSLAAVPLFQVAPDPSNLLRLAANEIRSREFAAAQRHLQMLLAKHPNSAEGYNLLGVCKASLGDPASAQQSFEESIRLDARLPDAHVNLGQLLLQRYDRQGALKQFEAAVALDPNALTRDSESYNGFNLLGLCRMDEHKYEAARNAFARAVQINPRYSTAYANLGLALVALGRDPEALKAFRSALEIRPQDPVAISNMGLIYARQRNFREAAQYLRQAHTVAPGDPEVAAALAGADIQCGQDAEAEALVGQLAEAGRLTPSMRTSLAVTWLQKAEIQRAVQLARSDPEAAARFYRLSYEKAEAMFEENSCLQAAYILEAIRDLRAPDAAYYGLLGSVYYALDEPKKASDNFQAAIRLDPSDPDYYFRLGMIFLKHHTPKPAIYIFRTAVESQPTSAKLWFGLGMSYYFASNITEGEQALRKAIGIAPNYEIAYIVLGDLLQETGRLGEAATTFQDAIHLQPNSFVPYYYLGAVSSRMGTDKLNTSISMLRKAVKLNPSFAEAYYALGKSLAQAGQFSEAIMELQKSLELEPHLTRAHYQLGRIYEKEGKTALARKQLQLFVVASEKENSHDLIRQLVVQIGQP